MIVYAISKELPLAAANPISLVMALDSECLVEPSFAIENADKLLEDIQRFLFLSIPKRCVSCFHIAPARSFKGLEDSRVQKYVITARKFHKHWWFGKLRRRLMVLVYIGRA